MSERELVAMFFGGWIVGAVAITLAMLYIERERRRGDRVQVDSRILVQDEVLRNIVKQSASLAEIAAQLRVIAEVIMCLDTSVSKEERQ